MRFLFATIQRQSQHGFKGKQKEKSTAVEMEGLNQTTRTLPPNNRRNLIVL